MISVPTSWTSLAKVDSLWLDQLGGFQNAAQAGPSRDVLGPVKWAPSASSSPCIYSSYSIKLTQNTLFENRILLLAKPQRRWPWRFLPVYDFYLWPKEGQMSILQVSLVERVTWAHTRQATIHWKLIHYTSVCLMANSPNHWGIPLSWSFPRDSL